MFLTFCDNQMFLHLKKIRILSLFFTVLVVLNSIELHQCVRPSSSRQTRQPIPHLNEIAHSPSADLDEESIEIKLMNGLCFYGRVTFPGGKKIPIWLYRKQKEPTTEFLAFIILDSGLHALATMQLNRNVAPKPPTDQIIVRIHVGTSAYFLANSFEAYDVKHHYHGPRIQWGSRHYPARNYVYINVPQDDGTILVYRSLLQDYTRYPLSKFL